MNEGVSSVVVVDADERSRMLIVGPLQRAGYVTVEVASGAEALEAVRAHEVALVVLEVELPDMSGYEVCRDLRSAHDDVPIFFVSATHVGPVDRVAGLLLGADDFIVKPFDSSELLARVRRVVSRRSTALAGNTFNGAVGAPSLTEREREVLDLLAKGRRQKEIAGELSISPKTVAAHIQNLFGKVGVHSRAELVARAYLLGLVGLAPAGDGAGLVAQLR